MSKRLQFFIGFIFGAGLLLALHLRAKEAVTKDHMNESAIKVREEMISISKQLGVTCIYCHDTKNFRAATMPTWKTAFDHIRITKWLNEQGFRGHPKIDCFLCHRGQAKPNFKMEKSEPES